MSAITLRSMSTMYPVHSGSTPTITSMQTSGTQMEITYWITACIALPVHLAQDDIQRTDDGHDVRHQVPANHFVERFQIDE